jgi:molecular chaperone DnaK (HSP70)
VFNPCDDSDD